jgi:uncharacterized protein
VSLLSGNVLLTGATGGIGQAIARALAPRGAQLLLTGRRTDVLESLSNELGARHVACDLASHEDVDRLLTASGEIDILIANAALPSSGPLTGFEQAQIDRALDVNLRAPVALARGLLPGMIDRGRGHMVFISSLQGRAATPGASLYCATKFGLRGFALALREDVRAHGIGVSVVLPGFIREAGMFADAGVRLPRGIGTRAPEDVAVAVIHAIERNRAELDVASAPLRLGAVFAGLAPQTAATVSRLMGSEKIAAEFALGQRDKR